MSHRFIACFSKAGFHRVAYREYGDPANPRVVICVHGLTRNGMDFEPLARALSERFRIICPDVVGRGASDWLDDKSAYGYPQYIADMTALIARSGAKEVDWIGTSMGGFMGMLMAGHASSPIARLVMNDIGPFIPEAALIRIANYAGGDPRFPDRAALDAYMREVYAPFGPFTASQWQAMVDSTVRETAQGDIALAYDPGIVEPLRAGPIADVDAWPLWDALSQPVLLIRGADSDVLTADTARQMCERGPRARMLEIAGVGHAPSLMSADQIDAVCEFLLA